MQNFSKVVWRMGNNVDPKRYTVIIEDPLELTPEFFSASELNKFVLYADI